MGGSRTWRPLVCEAPELVCPAESPGPLGFGDRGDPILVCMPGDSPGPVGTADAGSSGAFTLPVPATRPVDTGLTPLGFMRQYRPLTVTWAARGETTRRRATVDIRRYNINRESSSHAANLGEKDRICQGIRRLLRAGAGDVPIAVEAGHRQRVAGAFFGKAFPEDYQLALLYALYFGRNGSLSPDEYAYSRARLGLDCSGFVNAYLLRSGRLPGITSVSRAPTIRAHYRRSETAGLLRNAAEAVRPYDLLIWADYGHIGIVDPSPVDGGGFRVVESAATGEDGLNESHYTVRSVGVGGRFDVHRGENRRNDTSHVFICGVP